MITPNERIKENVSYIEGRLAEATETANQNSANIEQTIQTMREAWQAMCWRDRYVWGYLGSRKKYIHYQSLKTIKTQYEQAAEGLTKTVAEQESRIDEIIHDHLEKNDPEYNQLAIPYEAGKEVQREIESTTRLIIKAIAGVKEATTSQRLNALSGGKIGIFAAMDNKVASKQIDDINTIGLPYLIKALKKYDRALISFGINGPVNNPLNERSRNQTLLPGNVFFDLSNVKTLENVTAELEYLKDEIAKIGQRFSQEFEPLLENLSKRRNEFREACRL